MSDTVNHLETNLLNDSFHSTNAHKLSYASEWSITNIVTNTYSFDSILPNKGISLVHLNIRSLLPKIDELLQYLNNSKIKVCSINETFLDSTVDDSEFSIPSFYLYRNYNSRKGGGSAIYV